MKALVYTGPNELTYRATSDPVASPGSSIVKVESVGICGSDMHAFTGHDARRPPPLILGHEAAGTCVSGAFAGRQVTINPVVSCGCCMDCQSGRENICPNRELISMPPREGAFAEMVAVPNGNLVTVPAGVPADHAALVEPLAVGWHAVRLARDVLFAPISEATCLVLGGGAIGVGLALCLREFGAEKIQMVEPNDDRRNLIARKTRFSVMKTADNLSEEGKKPDLVLDAVGSAATRKTACESVRQGGFIIHVGLHSGSGGLDAWHMTVQEIGFLGTYTYSIKDFRETARAVFSGRLGLLDWVECRSLVEGQGAFEDILGGKVAAPKIILKP